MRNEQGAALVSVTFLLMFLALLAAAYFKIMGFEAHLTGVGERAAQALYCADSGIEYGRWKLMHPNSWVSSSYPPQPVGDNMGIFSVEFNLVSSNETSRIGSLISDGTYMGLTRRVVADVFINIKDQNIIFSSNGALIGPSRLTGGMDVDGRNHQPFAPYNVIPDSGTWAIVTEAAGVNVTGNVRIGGTGADGTDYPSSGSLPKYTDLDAAALNKIVKFNATDLPKSADGIFNQPEGTLKQLAMENGTFYSGVPPNNYQLKTGINYIQLPQGQDWNAQQILPPAGGEPMILIVHNDAGTATVNNLGANISTVLPGLVVLDNVKFIKCIIIGALFIFNKTDEIDVGNGNAQLLFCRNMLKDILSFIAKVKITGWREEIPI